MIRPALAAFLVAGSLAVGASPKPQTLAIEPTLDSVREVRVATLIEPDENAFVFDSDKPGLSLKFTLHPPSGLTLLEVRQPARIVATDSTGADLAGIEPGFMDELEYVALEQSFGDAPTGFTMRLTAPARSATSFTLAADFDAVFFAGTTTDEVAASREWSDLPASLTGGETVRIRLGGGANNAQLEMQPGTAKERFEEVILLAGGAELESNGTMWNDDEATFLFSGSSERVTAVRFVARTGLREQTVRINLVEQALP
ncbi:MAG: hypothetical protein ACF8QF_13860 [Phycisphaerales bacterium]